MSDNKNENKTEILNEEEAKRKELCMEELEQVSGGVELSNKSQTNTTDNAHDSQDYNGSSHQNLL